ncbi:uncharacterized protein LOC104907323 [Beta vulgaris subsp. vulgaris]|uniref:uncharacterized protein LOC104907323 n=1 Tax=Beta vulgaris subsp. vulgaris TaxID=3555 RepID=UPI00053FBEC5|nr:uncharacterized protein LOC104907323 [Beta vulgaris subsp. vulgaris]
MDMMSQNLFSGWCFSSNFVNHPSGRSVMAWNDQAFHVEMKVVTDQLMHSHIRSLSGTHEFECTFVYAQNSAKQRKALWRDLEYIAQKIKHPWVAMGDYNCILNREERVGSAVRDGEMLEFRRCINNCELDDLKSTSYYYTWNNKQYGDMRVYCKLDRVLFNEKWCEKFRASKAWFMPGGMFDHSPIVLFVFDDRRGGNTHFKYYKMWSQALSFLNKVRECWESRILGTTMFRVVQKLKTMKNVMKNINKHGFSEMQVVDAKAYEIMIECQHHLKQDPGDIKKEERVVAEYKKVHECYLSFLRQKAKLAWIQQGDENSSLFHRAIRKRRMQNNVYGIHDMNGTLVEGDKSPGPDGFGTHFFKDTWSIVGSKITAAIKDFFTSGKLLTEVNTTILTLIPKVKCPSSVSDFRPIACCNTIYKCITKVMCDRIKAILPVIIGENLGASIKGRFIGHNIMICQDLVFIIPKKVLNDVESICRSFLWTEEYYSGRPGYVAWVSVCLPKYAGGLGIRQINKWNIADIRQINKERQSMDKVD